MLASVVPRLFCFSVGLAACLIRRPLPHNTYALAVAGEWLFKGGIRAAYISRFESDAHIPPGKLSGRTARLGHVHPALRGYTVPPLSYSAPEYNGALEDSTSEAARHMGTPFWAPNSLAGRELGASNRGIFGFGRAPGRAFPPDVYAGIFANAVGKWLRAADFATLKLQYDLT